MADNLKRSLLNTLILGGPLVFAGMMVGYTYNTAEERTAELLEDLGYENIFVFDGSYEDMPRCYPAPAVGFTATNQNGEPVKGNVCASTRLTERSVKL